MELIDKFNEQRQKGNDAILGEDFLPFKRFFALDGRAYEEGSVPVKYKELMGLVGSMVLRCDDCVTYHVQRAAETGCSREEIREAFNIALVIGGSIVIPHLRRAYGVLDELIPIDNK